MTEPGAGSNQSKQQLNPVLASVLLIGAIGVIGGLMWNYSRPVPPPIRVMPTEPATHNDESAPSRAPRGPKSPEEQKRDEQVCLEHLRAIGKALQAYRRDHPDPRTHGLPKQLSDLSGNYLKDPRSLICPAFTAASAAGALAPGLPQDANRAQVTTYNYSLGAPPTHVYPGPEWGCQNCTWFDWIESRGDETPIIICMLHAKPATKVEEGTIGPFCIVRLGGRIEFKRFAAGVRQTQY